MADVWHFFADQDDLLKRTVVRSCERAGLPLYPFDPQSTASDPGLLFFHRVDERLLRLVCRLSSAGLRRVIAVGLPGSRLNADAILRLRENGASHVCTWEACQDSLGTLLMRLERWARVDELLDSTELRSRVAGTSPLWVSTLRDVVDIAVFGDARLPVLLTGETGTGKEVIARLIHELDPRAAKSDLVVLDGSAVSPTLSHSEFFGHERGAFTDAHVQRPGAFALARGGTLFIDEIGELSIVLQAQILRAVQERTYKPIGGTAWNYVDFRLVCATQRNLAEDVEKGAFRRDLYHRLAGCSISLPPLRHRLDDIIPLAECFFGRLRRDGGGLELEDSLRDYLLSRDYPGNVRELEQLVHRIHHRHTGDGPFTLADVPEDDLRHARPVRDDLARQFDAAAERALQRGAGLKEIASAAGEAAERAALRLAHGQCTAASRFLRVSVRALQARLKRKKERERERERLTEGWGILLSGSRRSTGSDGPRLSWVEAGALPARDSLDRCR